MIRFQFVAGSALSSRLIAWWGNGWHGYSHVDCMLANGSLVGARSDVIGGVRAGVQVRPQNYEKWLRRTIMTLQTTDSQAKQWEAFVLSQVGLQYDKRDIVDLIMGRRPESLGRWICSAFGTDSLEVIGRMPALCIPPQQVTPDTLAAIVSALGASISVEQS